MLVQEPTFVVRSLMPLSTGGMMVQAPLPTDEARRLEALHDLHILDSPPEAVFDQLAVLAAQLCEVPIALITLVDRDRQWFKACVGLDATGTNRESSFCAHAILQSDQLMVVPDATQDPRFEDNPLVTGKPNIRFYAGAQLRTRDGHALGTLCVIDRVPRTLRASQLNALRTLVGHAAAQIELLRIQRILDTSGPTTSSAATIAAELRDAVAARDRAELGLRKTEAELRQFREEELLGHLTHGVVHDLNNLLAVVQGSAELLHEDLLESAPQSGLVAAILEASRQGGSLTREVLAFGRRSWDEGAIAELDEVIGDATSLVRSRYQEIEVDLRLAAAKVPVRMEPSQLGQILINLVLNAADAMPEGGRLTVETRDGGPAHLVTLAVRDTGCGMDAKTRDQAFQPFFTTKDSSTGLGLATVKSIVERRGGLVSLFSRSGHGTTVEVLLPRHQVPAAVTT